MKKKSFCFLFFAFFLTEAIYAQYNSVKAVVLSGGSVSFNFNSIDKYTSGIRINNGTILGITLQDINTDPVPTPGSTIDGFELYFSTTAANIDGEAATSLVLTKIQIEASNVMGLAGGTYFGLLDLINGSGGVAPTAPTGNKLMEYNDPAIPLPAGAGVSLSAITHQVGISYECGMTGANNFLNEAASAVSGTYVVDIEFWIWPQCNGMDCPP